MGKSYEDFEDVEDLDDFGGDFEDVENIEENPGMSYLPWISHAVDDLTAEH